MDHLLYILNNLEPILQTTGIPGTQYAVDFARTSPDKLHHFQKQQRPHSLLAVEKQIKLNSRLLKILQILMV